jgi:hypothetical protein
MEKLLMLLWNIDDVVREHASQIDTCLFTLTNSFGTWHLSECVSKCRASGTTCCGGRKHLSNGTTRSTCKYMQSAHFVIPRMSLGNIAQGFLLSVPCPTRTASGSSGCWSSVGILSLDGFTSPLGPLHSYNGRAQYIRDGINYTVNFYCGDRGNLRRRIEGYF